MTVPAAWERGRRCSRQGRPLGRRPRGCRARPAKGAREAPYSRRARRSAGGSARRATRQRPCRSRWARPSGRTRPSADRRSCRSSRRGRKGTGTPGREARREAPSGRPGCPSGQSATSGRPALQPSSAPTCAGARAGRPHMQGESPPRQQTRDRTPGLPSAPAARREDCSEASVPGPGSTWMPVCSEPLPCQATRGAGPSAHPRATTSIDRTFLSCPCLAG